MPYRPAPGCLVPLCPNRAVKAGRCAQHQQPASYDQTRGTASQRGYGADWRRARARYLRDHPLCAICGETATHVDHVVAHRGDPALFWDESNWQALCASCHARKTASRDAGFGNRRSC